MNFSPQTDAVTCSFLQH